MFETLPEFIAVLGGVMVALIPVTGLTLRFAVMPLIREIGTLRAKRSDLAVELLQARVTTLEMQMELVAPGTRAFHDAVAPSHRKLIG